MATSPKTSKEIILFMKKYYLIKDKVYNTFVAYGSHNLTSDCWTIVKENASRYFTLKEAKKVRHYMAKICAIRLKDLEIISVIN